MLWHKKKRSLLLLMVTSRKSRNQHFSGPQNKCVESNFIRQQAQPYTQTFSHVLWFSQETKTKIRFVNGFASKSERKKMPIRAFRTENICNFDSEMLSGKVAIFSPRPPTVGRFNVRRARCGATDRLTKRTASRCAPPLI